MEGGIKQKRLDYIIEKAETVFFEKGYEGSSVLEICQRADCSRTTFYTHFENKDNIYYAVASRSFRAFIQYFDRFEMGKQNGLDSLLMRCQGYLRFTVAYPRNYQVILGFYQDRADMLKEEVPEDSSRLWVFKSEVIKLARLPIQAMLQEIQRGQDDQSIKNELSPEELLSHLWAYLIGLTTFYPLSSAIYPPKKLANTPQYLESQVLDLIRKIML